jgi:hypothetical protein
MSIVALRHEYHGRVCREILRKTSSSKSAPYPNLADGGSKSSVEIAWALVRKLGCSMRGRRLSGQTVGKRFEAATRQYLEASFRLLHHLRPGEWHYFLDKPISSFDQYEHLAYLDQAIGQDTGLSTALGGDYIVKPDIVVGRAPVSDEDINQQQMILGGSDAVATLTPLRSGNRRTPPLILHASISCKWTIRSDRAQNTRTEALNLVRNRKGNLPHIASVTAEPLPTRLATLALGTGDLDCVYHFALPELRVAVQDAGSEDQLDMLLTLIEGRRLRDISDLPFDLAV